MAGRPKKPRKPRVVIDYDKLKAYMRLKPTLVDCSAFFGVSEDTIERLIKKNDKCTYAEFRNKNMVHTRNTLVRKAIDMATKGNVPMLIFCLKNLCNWVDKKEITNEEGKAFKLSYDLGKK